MSLFTKLFEAVHSWRRRRGGIKSRKRSDLTMEQLDHRQLLAVNFTGNVPIDFPATESPGVVVIPAPANNQTPIIPTNLQPYITTSGLEIDSLSVSYDATDDILSVGVRGAADAVNGQDDIAADTDNNGNSGTVNPNVLAIESQFQDPADMGGTKTYGVFFDLTNSGTPDIIAGFPQASPDPTSQSPKPFEVAAYNDTPSGDPFDNSEIFPQYTGSYYLANDPAHPNFEFQIDHFSQLYQAMTGNTLSATTTFGIGALASNNQSTGISDEFFPLQTETLGPATVPPVVPPVPPVPPPPIVLASPTIYVNVHENNHINSAHPTAVRVNVLGSSGFDPTTIIPSTVRLGDPTTIGTTGATPILNFERNVNHDEFPDETFVFDSTDLDLPSGITTVQLSGETTSGVFFNSQVKVFNRDDSFYTTAEINKQTATWLKYDAKNGIDTSNGAVAPPPVIPKAAQQLAASMAIDDLYAPFAKEKVPAQVNPGLANTTSLGTAMAASTTSAPVVVSIPTKHGKASKASNVTLSSVSSGSQATSSGAVFLSGGS